MDYALLRKYHAARPFRPFNVVTGDGRSARVLHPEFMALDPAEQIVAVVDPQASHCIIDAAAITMLKYPKLANGQAKSKRR
jgi:hypothetical protein